MSHVEAIYRRGVFQPLQPVDLNEDQRVRLSIEPPAAGAPAAGLLSASLDIAIKYDRAVYDALFIALAQDRSARAVTADEPLFNVTHSDFPKVILLRDWR